MARLREIIECLATVAPPQLALGFDNSGLNVGDEEEQISGIMIALDATSSVIAEAKERGCNLIISHHPLVFSKIENLTAGIGTNSLVIQAVKAGVNVYSMHTNLDSLCGGINDAMAGEYGMTEVKILIPNGENSGIGRVGKIAPTTVRELALFTKNKFLAPIRYNDMSEGKEVDTIAVINGAGLDEETVKLAKNEGADVVVSAEIKHHVALYAKESNVSVIETGHYASEKFYLPCLARKVDEALQAFGIEIKVMLSVTEADPMPYTV